MTLRETPVFRKHSDEFAERGYTLFRFDSPRFKALVADAFRASQQVISSGGRFGASSGFRSAKGKPYHYTHPHRNLPEFRALLECAEVAEMTRAVLGDQPVYVTHSKLSFKHFGEDQRWLPHQDAGYKPERRLGCTLAFFLEACDASNGTLEVFPFSHRLGTLKHRVVSGAGDLTTQLEVEELPEGIAPVRVEAGAGDVLCFDLKTLHQSGPNQRSGSRVIFLLEVEPLAGPTCDDLGLVPFVLNGSLSPRERLVSLVRGSRRRARAILSMCKSLLRERIETLGKRFLA